MFKTLRADRILGAAIASIMFYACSSQTPANQRQTPTIKTASLPAQFASTSDASAVASANSTAKPASTTGTPQSATVTSATSTGSGSSVALATAPTPVVGVPQASPAAAGSSPSTSSSTGTLSNLTNIPVRVHPVVTCQYNKKNYNVGDSFDSSDGCNRCGCQDGGQVVCSARACLAPPPASSGHTVGMWYSAWYTVNAPTSPQNLWTDWSIPYVPRVLDQFRVYDSGETAVIDEHIQMLTNAGVDFIILDLTNHIGTGFILQRAQAICSRIMQWNSTHPTKMLKYAVAIGATQWSGDPADIETEAGNTLSWFVQTYGVNNYFQWAGKPLLVANDQGVRAKWNALTPKPNSDNFTFKWWNGTVTSSSIPVTEYGNYVGWAFTSGALPSSEAMMVLPGWNNMKGASPIDRYLGGVEGGFYQTQGWNIVLANNPKLVVINSFNEYAENTAIAPAKTDNLANTAGTNKWSAPDFYWNLTQQFIAQYRSLPTDAINNNPMHIVAGNYGVNGSIYYSNGSSVCSIPFIELYQAMGSPAFIPLYAVPTLTNSGGCNYPPGNFRVGTAIYYSNGSQYCHMNSIPQNWTQFPALPSNMPFNGDC